MSIEAKILLDSVNPLGNRITTWVLTYPRFIHAEFMTHRGFSRNASSSRAIPVKKMLEDVKNNPAMPVYWGKNQSGMQAAEELDSVNATIKEYYNEPLNGGSTSDSVRMITPRAAAEKEWLAARDVAVRHVEKMVEIGLHKQIANRLLEPWMHITVLATATEHENFFALRAHKDAQPEFQALAYKMLDLYQSSNPKRLAVGEWHIPFGDTLDHKRVWEITMKRTHFTTPFIMKKDENYFTDYEDFRETALKISTARCARVSYLNFEGKDDYEADIALTERLLESGHWSPFEHCATPYISGTIPFISGNFVGWKQYRKQFSQENRRDGRVPDILPATRLY